jgi:5'-AMP-activated protein kinase, regulatory beta subunit
MLASSLGTDGGTTSFVPRSPPGEYDQDEELDESVFIKEPPSLPPHLMRALLNTAPVCSDDPVLLPLPHHVMIDHCYFLSRPGTLGSSSGSNSGSPAAHLALDDDDAMSGVRVVGMTHRYRAKFVTTVFYLPADLEQSEMP